MSNEFNENAGEARERASIGSSISIKGEISGSEDLLIRGTVEGTVNLGDNTVTVGQSAKVAADIFGKTIHVEGEVVGNLNASEQIVIHRSGYVRGNITVPRLSLEDGARIKGSIDTEPASKQPGLAVEMVKSDNLVNEARRNTLQNKNATAAARPNTTSSMQ